MAHVDQLLEEYLRVINAKDDEIHGLIRGLEEQRCELKKREDTHRTDAVSTRQKLRRALKRLKTMEQQHLKDNEEIMKLTVVAEVAKKQVAEMERKLAEVEKGIDWGQEKHRRELENIRQQHDADVQDFRKRHDELKAERASLLQEQEAIQKAKEACELKAQQLQAIEASKEELKEALKSTRRAMECMVPMQRHEEAMAAHEESLRSVRESAAAEISSLKTKLSSSKEVAEEFRKELDGIQELHIQLQKRYDETSLERDKVRKELHVEREEFKRFSDVQQKEMDLARDVAAKATTELEIVTSQLKQSAVDLQTLKKKMKKISGELEIERDSSSKGREQMDLQLSALRAKTEDQQRELGCLQRKLHATEVELKDSQSTFFAAKEEWLRGTAEMKERFALSTAERDRAKDERERFAFELKDAQHQISILQERLSEDRRVFSAKVDDAKVTIERMRDQLREKEHQLQMSTSTQEKRLQEAEWTHKSQMAECKNALESKVSDLCQRLESANVQLAEMAASSNVYRRDLQTAQDAERRNREECERRIAETRESLRMLENARREVSSLREKMDEQQKLLDAATDKEMQLKRSIEQIEIGRAAETVRHEFLAEALDNVREELAAKQAEVVELRRELKEGNDEGTKAESLELALKLREAQRHMEQLQRELDHQLLLSDKLQERIEAAEKTRRDATDELSRVSAELGLKAAECTRVMEHAKEVETLAKESCKELEQELTHRDAMIVSLQQEASLLGEERAKVALLEERLAHQAELNRRDVENLSSRVVFLEKELQERDSHLQQHLEKSKEVAAQFADLQARTNELEEEMVRKEKKHVLRKEALRKALEQVDLAVGDKVEAGRSLSKERASHGMSIEAYKDEVQSLQEQLKAAHNARHAAEKRLWTQEESLTEATKAVSEGQSVLQDQLAYLKQQQLSQLSQHAEELKEAQERIDALGRELSRARGESHLAEESKRELHQHATDMERRIINTYSRLLSNFSDDAIMMKETYGDFAVSLAARALRQLGQVMHGGWSTAMSFTQQCGDYAKQQEVKLRHEIEELKLAHADELRAAVEERNREVSRMVVQHGTDIAQLRQEIADVTTRANWEVESTLREYRRREEQFHRDKTELECSKLEIAHQGDQIAALKEQLRGLEQRTEAERAAIDQEKRSLRQQQERIRRQLDDCAMEQNRYDVEVRELRSDLSSLQHVLQEKENALAGERERIREDSRRMAALTTEKEALQAQVGELRRQLQQLQEQLSVARQGAQHASRTGTLEQNRLEERIAELTNALNALSLEKRRLDRQTRNDGKKISLLEKELIESRKRESEMSNQLQARRAENSALKERCANLDSLKNIGECALAETRLREKNLLEKIEEMRTAQQLMQLCFDKQQEQLEVGRRMHEQDVNRSGLLYKESR